MRSLVGALLNKTPVPQTGRASTGLFAGLTGTRGMTAQMRAMGEVGTLFAIVSRTSNATSQVEWKLWRKAKSGKKEDRVEVVSHPALDLWNQPNKFTTRQELVEAGQQHVDLTGEGWLVIGRNPKVRNLPLELWTVRPDRMAPVEDRDDFIAGYTYTAPDGEVVPLERDDVLMLRMPNPLDPYRGMGPVQAILTNIDSAKYSAEWNRNFFLNSAEPGGVIEVPTRLSDAEWAEMNTRWREQHQGVANAHRVAVIEQGKWVNRTFSMRDMQFAELREVSRDVMLEAFGFPKFMLGAVDDVNRANAEASAAMFAQWLVRPRLERWKGMLNNDLLPLYGSVGQGLEFDYENPVPPDGEAENAARDSKVKAVATLVPLGFDADEAMEFFGLPAIKFEKPEPPPGPPPASSGESGAPAAPAEGAPRNVGGSFLELAGRFRTRSGVVARHLGPQAARTYKRDKDGKFSSGDGGGDFDNRVADAATGDEALRAAPFNRDTEDRLVSDFPGFDDFEGTGIPGHVVGNNIAHYGDNGHETVNGVLRSGGDPLHPPASLAGVLHYSPQVVTDQVIGLDAAMSRSKLTTDVVVHRGVGDAKKVFGTSSDLTGLQFRDRGYVSTTTSGSASGEFSGNRTGVQMRILVPKGTGAISSYGLDRTELLLDRGLTFVVRRDYQVDGLRTLDVEATP